jgi:hypothetical protein
LTTSSKKAQSKKATTRLEPQMNLEELLFKPASLQLGEVRYQAGIKAMCLRPYDGGKWATVGRFVNLTVDGSGYVGGKCVNVDGAAKTVWLQIITGPFTPGTVIKFPVSKIGRYFEASDKEESDLEHALTKLLEQGIGDGGMSLEDFELKIRSAREKRMAEEQEAFLNQMNRLIGPETYQLLGKVERLYRDLLYSVGRDSRRSREVPTPHVAKVTRNLKKALGNLATSLTEGC